MSTPTQLVYRSVTGRTITEIPHQCWLCGGPAFDAVLVTDWIKDTFTDIDKAAAVHSDVICGACVWCALENNIDVQSMVKKPKPQKARSYTWIVVPSGVRALTKANKRDMSALLTAIEFPELAVISESGQKHLIFRAAINPPGQSAGWVQFEERRIWIDARVLARQIAVSVALMEMGFGKAEIETGRYGAMGLRALEDKHAWFDAEALARSYRATSAWSLAVWLSQKEEEQEDD